MDMTLKPLFVVCMFSALHQLWHIDLSMLAGAILFPKSWRTFPNDLLVLILSFSLLCVLQDYESWRYWYPVTLFESLEVMLDRSVALFSEHITTVAEGDYSRFLRAVLLGQKDDISAETTALFKALGISHVLAISGFHIGFWIVCIRPLFIWARSPLTRGAMLIVQFFILYYYALMVGASPSVLRAVWMFLFARVVALRNSGASSLQIVMLVAIGHYLVNPKAPQSISYQLSYTAVFAILLALKRNDVEQLVLQYSFRGHIRKGNWFFVPIQISLAAWSATLPIVQGSFGGASPYFLFGNLLVVPLITVMIWASVPLLVFGRLLPEEIKGWYARAWETLVNGAEQLLLFLEQLGQSHG